MAIDANTEKQWQESNNWKEMLRILLSALEGTRWREPYLETRIRDNQYRLLTCSLIRLMWNTLTKYEKSVVKYAENLAHVVGVYNEYSTLGLSKLAANLYAEEPRPAINGSTQRQLIALLSLDNCYGAYRSYLGFQANPLLNTVNAMTSHAPSTLLCNMLRDIFGNPYRINQLQRHYVDCPDCDGTGEVRLSHRSDCYDCSGSGKTARVYEWVTPEIASIAQAAISTRADNTLKLEKLKKDMDTLHFIAARTTSDGAYRNYMANLAGLQEKLNQATKLNNVALDQQNLMVLADAIEIDSECPAEVECYYCKKEDESDGYDARNYACDQCNNTSRITNPIITHLRASEFHTPGCWVLSLLLGKYTNKVRR